MTPIEIKFYSRANIFSPFYQVLGFKIRKGAFFGDTLYITRSKVFLIGNFMKFTSIQLKYRQPQGCESQIPIEKIT